MDEELFGEGSSSEEEEPQQQEEQDEAAAESGDDSSGSEKEETAAAGSDSEPESKASSVGGEEEKSEEESGNEQEGSDEEGVAHGTEEQQEAQDGSDDDSSAAGDEAAATAASSGDEQAGSEAGSVGGQTPVQSDSDEDQAANPEIAEAEKSESEEEQSDGEDNKETKDSDEEGEDIKEKTTAESSDSGSEIGGKRPKVQDSDSSEEDNATEKAEKSDLFGDADDISSSDEEKMETQEKEQQQEVEEEGEETRRAMVYSEDEAQEEVKQQAMEEEQRDETRIEVEIPKINTNLGSSIHFVRFPNFVSVETRPFDPAVYEDEIEDDELLDEEGRTRMKLKVENTIRWKKYVDENGMQLTESNARLVRWSDGSMSMHLGSEIFDVHVMPLQGDHNHLFIRQGTGLQGQAVFKTKLTFRPHSTKSATHRKMTSRLAMRLNQNQQKVRVLPIAGQDPESRKAKLMKEEEDQLRAHMRREAQKRRMREKAHARGLNTNYLDDRLEEEDDSGAISVSAIKNKFKPGFGGVGRGIYSSDSDSGDEKQLTNAKRLESDDSDDDLGKKKKTDDGEKKKKYVVSDSESENEDNKETTAGTSENPTADESMEQASDSDE